MTKLKTCKICKEEKTLNDNFYCCRGFYRSECKPCFIKKTGRYQKKNQTWKKRGVDLDAKRAYMANYYRMNKEKYVEYARRLKERNPDYHRDYVLNKKHKQYKSGDL